MNQTEKYNFKTVLKNSFFLTVGVIMASIGLKGFLLPNGFLDGGAMGIALLIEKMTTLNLSMLIVLVNLPFIILAINQVSLLYWRWLFWCTL